MWAKYRWKQYREFQHPFASELQECLKLGYSDFTAEPGKDYADTVSEILGIMKTTYGVDVHQLRLNPDDDQQILYHYYVFLYAKAILSKMGDLIRNKRICGVELKGPLKEREIKLSDFKYESNSIVQDVHRYYSEGPIPEKWKKKFQTQKASVDENNKRPCQGRCRKFCCPLRSQNIFLSFQQREVDALESKLESIITEEGIMNETQDIRLGEISPLEDTKDPPVIDSPSLPKQSINLSLPDMDNLKKEKPF